MGVDICTANAHGHRSYRCRVVYYSKLLINLIYIYTLIHSDKSKHKMGGNNEVDNFAI